MSDPARHSVHLLRLLGDTLHAAATALEAGDERRASALLRAVYEAVQAGEPARDWAALVQLLEPHAVCLQEPVWPFGEDETSDEAAPDDLDQPGGG